MTAPLTTVARGDGSLIAEPLRTIVRDAGSWRALWAAHAGPDAAAPDVDFSGVIVAAAFAGERPSAGFEVEIRPGAWEGTRRLLDVFEQRPRAGVIAAQMIVTPFHIVSLPRGDVAFSGGAAPAAAPSAVVAAPARSAAPSPVLDVSSTGLDPKAAAALAYLAGPFSGAVILLAERNSVYVRFHAWQSILGLGGLGILALGLLAAAFAGLVVSPLLFTLLYRLSAAAALAWVVVGVIGVVTAALGSTRQWPLVGKLADRRA